MRQELDELLCKRYPKIFAQRHLPKEQTCMCWGFCFGDGWFHIVDLLCRYIQGYIDRKSLPQVEAVQVKEKFGGLRFYTTAHDDVVDSAIDYAGYLSQHTCENCGSMDDVGQTSGWVTTLCRKCAGEKSKTWASWDEIDAEEAKEKHT